MPLWVTKLLWDSAYLCSVSSTGRQFGLLMPRAVALVRHCNNAKLLT